MAGNWTTARAAEGQAYLWHQLQSTGLGHHRYYKLPPEQGGIRHPRQPQRREGRMWPHVRAPQRHTAAGLGLCCWPTCPALHRDTYSERSSRGFPTSTVRYPFSWSRAELFLKVLM